MRTSLVLVSVPDLIPTHMHRMCSGDETSLVPSKHGRIMYYVLCVKVSYLPSSDESTVGPAEGTVAADELQQMRTPGELATLRHIRQSHHTHTHLTHYILHTRTPPPTTHHTQYTPTHLPSLCTMVRGSRSLSA